MAGTNQFLPWATGATANVMPLVNYTGSGGQLNGVSAGIADPTIINRAIRQGTFIAAGLAQFVANFGPNVNDDGNLANFVTNLTNALHVSVNVPPFASNAVAAAGTDGASIISPASLHFVLGQQVLLLTGGSIQGNLAVNGSVSATGPVSGGAASFASITVTGGANFAGASIAAASLAAATATLGISNAQSAQMPANTVKANPANAQGAPQDVAYATLLADMGVVLPTYAQFQCTQAETLTVNTFTRRLLNVTPYNGIAGATLSGNQVTLPAGTYVAHASASAYASSTATLVEMKLRVRNVTLGATLISGQNTYSGASTTVPDGGIAVLSGVFTLPAGGGTIELDSWQNASLTSGGVALGTGETDVYANLLLTKIA